MNDNGLMNSFRIAEATQLNRKQLEQINRFLSHRTINLIPESDREMVADFADRVKQDMAEHKVYLRSSAMASMLEFVNTYKPGSGGKCALVDQKRGRHDFRIRLDSLYSFNDSIRYEDGTLSFISQDAPAHRVNPTVLDFIRSHSIMSEEEVHDVVINRQQAVYFDQKKREQVEDIGRYTYTFTPSDLSKASVDARSLQRAISELIGYKGVDGYLTENIYCGYSDNGDTNYGYDRKRADGSWQKGLLRWLTNDMDRVVVSSRGHSPRKLMTMIDEILGHEVGTFEGVFKGELLKRGNSLQFIPTTNPVEKMMEFAMQAVRESTNEQESEAINSLMMPIDGEHSPLSIVTRALAIQNIRDDIERNTRILLYDNRVLEYPTQLTPRQFYGQYLSPYMNNPNKGYPPVIGNVVYQFAIIDKMRGLLRILKNNQYADYLADEARWLSSVMATK